jgi:hypothetical protein
VRIVLAVIVAFAVGAPAGATPPIPVLWSVRDDGAQRVAVTTLPTDGTILDRTDAGRLVVQTAAGLELEDSDGADRVLLPSTQSASWATFSPNGTRLLFCAAPGTIELAAADDGSLLRILAPDAGIGSWSREGRTIVYVGRVVDERGAVLAVAAGGGQPRVLASGAYFDSPPELSPDGRSLAYACGAGAAALCVAHAGRIRRYRHAGWLPLWSPNGRYVATQIVGNYNAGAGLVDVGKGKASVIAMPADVGVEYQPLAWSPDSTRLLYARRCDAGMFVPGSCHVDSLVRTVATRHNRRISYDGVSWRLAHWRGRTITYVTS